MDVMGLIGTATGVVSLAILVAQEARHFGDMPAISSASSKYRTILENNGSADATDVLVIQRDMSEPRPDSPRWKFQAIRAHDSARLDDARTDDETWFEVIYDHPHRRNRKIMTWCPARNDSNLARELFARAHFLGGGDSQQRGEHHACTSALKVGVQQLSTQTQHH